MARMKRLFNASGRRRVFASFIATALLLCSCTQAQVDRAAQISAAADARLAQADAAIALAQQAVDQGKKLADQLGSAEAQSIIAQARQGLAAASAARDVAKLASKGAHAALEAAKTAQAAGGSTIDVLIAVVGAFVPAAGVAGTAIRSAMKSAQALRQTVAGIEKSKLAMTQDQIENLHSALSESQDAHVKATVKLIKAKR